MKTQKLQHPCLPLKHRGPLGIGISPSSECPLRHPKVKPATSEKVAPPMPMGPRTTSQNFVDEAW